MMVPSTGILTYLRSMLGYSFALADLDLNRSVRANLVPMQYALESLWSVGYAVLTRALCCQPLVSLSLCAMGCYGSLYARILDEAMIVLPVHKNKKVVMTEGEPP